MFLDSSNSNMLSMNNCSLNYFEGIYLYSSSDNTLSNNICNSNYYDEGIYLHSSSYNTLSNNTCISNCYAGICLNASSDNTLSNNICSSNGWEGMYLNSSSYNTLSNNSCSSNGYEGMYLDSSSYNALTNNICLNDFNGIDLVFSSHNTLTNNNFSSNDFDGMFLGSSSHNTLTNNNCSSNGLYGMSLNWSSDNNEISLNQIYNNFGYGVNISSGSDNRIWRNTIVDNNGATSTYDASHVQARNNGTSNWWNSTDGHGNWWSDWQSPDSDWNGIVDDPYMLVGSAGAKDYYPLTTVDAEDPATQASLSGTLGYNQWYASSVSVTLNALDTFSGVNWTKYSTDGGSWQTYSSPISITSDGRHTIEFYSQDNSGRTEVMRNTTFKIDTTSSVTQASLSGNQLWNQWYVSSVNLTLDPVDTTSGVNWTKYSIDGGSPHVYSGSIAVTSDGTHIVEFYSQDNSGQTEVTRSVTFKIDTVAPSLSIDLVSDTKFTSDSVVVPWSSVDITSGVNRTEWSLDSATWQPCTGSSISLTGLKDGVHELVLRATDNAGNSITRSVSFKVNTDMFSMSGPMGPWLDVGLILVALVVIVLLVLLLRRRRRRTAPSKPEDIKQA